jgi:NodT family efflux transporter outer membrane factor (OMF) lipoprotein
MMNEHSCDKVNRAGRAAGRWVVVGTLMCAAAWLGGCMVGPDYATPEAPLDGAWLGAAGEQTRTEEVQRLWWTVFDDPALDRLVTMAYEQNLDLQAAGLRVLEARARRGIAVGEFFPQSQAVSGGVAAVNTSSRVANPAPNADFQSSFVGFDVFWEVDVWGRFRRGIEAADASLYATVMNYDDVLVTLVSEVASTYVTIRSLDKRIEFALSNVKIQLRTLDIVDVRFRHGEATDLDVQQARSNLTSTQSLVPRLQSERQQAVFGLCLLLGMKPTDLDPMLGPTADVPRPPRAVAIGVPAELLRRRPDIRRAEREAAAQSARIGIAASQLYPHFAISGSIGYEAENVGDLFSGESFFGAFGPSFTWNILNYGRIQNDIRVQDARFEQLIAQYQNTVLRAAAEVESASAAFVLSQQEESFLAQSVDAAGRAVDLALIQYRNGDVDFIRVLDTQTVLANQQDLLVTRQRDVALSLVTLHRALGGGWELHSGREFVNEAVLSRMRQRTDWGNLISPDYPQGELIKPAAFDRPEQPVVGPPEP